MSAPHVPDAFLPENLTRAQYEHLHQHLAAFQRDKGDSIVDYFSDLAGNPRYHDLYERVCDDLGIERIASTPPRHRADC